MSEGVSGSVPIHMHLMNLVIHSSASEMITFCHICETDHNFCNKSPPLIIARPPPQTLHIKCQ